jgi:UDP-glucose 4-epimerase
MRVLITGGAGFIGSALAQAYLRLGAEVVVADSLIAGNRERVPAGAAFVQVDVVDDALDGVFVDRGPFDLVSHHAALKDVRKALVDPRSDAETNVLGTLNALRCAARHGTGRFVYASSAAVYGDAAVLPTPETAPLNPISPYGISKAAAEAYCAFFARSLGLPAVALRYGSVYGPAATEQTEAGVVTIFAKRMLAGRRPAIYGDGNQTRDLVSVEDVVRAHLLAGERVSAPWAVYNVASGVETSVNRVCRVLQELTGFAEPADYQAPKPGEVRRNVQDISRIAGDLGWSPAVSLEEGLAAVVAAIRSETSEPVAAGR